MSKEYYEPLKLFSGVMDQFQRELDMLISTKFAGFVEPDDDEEDDDED